MSNKNRKPNTNVVSRRQFLHGAGGFMLAIPFMPSLLPRDAIAANAAKRAFFLVSAHGAAKANLLYPGRNDTDNNMDEPYLSEWFQGSRSKISMASSQLYPGHMIRQGSIENSMYTSNGRTGISPMLSTPNASKFSAAIASKMHLHQGLDIPAYMEHYQGPLGNFTATNSEVIRAKYIARPSIDQVLAYSPKVYANGTSFATRSIEIGPGWEVVHRFSNTKAFTENVSSGISKIYGDKDALTIFNRLFANFSGGGTATPPPVGPNSQKLVVDKVLARWQSLRAGAFGDARRFSAEDRTRLEGYLETMLELQRKVTALSGGSSGGSGSGGASASCAKPGTPKGNEMGRNDNMTEKNAVFPVINDILAAAFACDLTRIATSSLYDCDGFSYSGDVHEDIWHKASATTNALSKITQHNQYYFDLIMLDLANKLNKYSDTDGKTVLDNSLLAWTQECGPQTHFNDATPFICIGSMGGVFNTGKYYDYRNMAAGSSRAGRKPGILLSQFFVTVLKGMGLVESDYLRINANQPGYSDTRRLDTTDANFSGIHSQVDKDAGKTLPLASNVT